MPTPATVLSEWTFHPVSGLALLLLLSVYVRGWQHVRVMTPDAPNRARLLSFAAGWVLLVVVFFSPLFALRDDLLLARTLQQVVLGLVAAPLLWLGAPSQTLRRGMPVAAGRALTRLVKGTHPLGRGVRLITQPAAVWLVTLASFLVWADPLFVAWSVASDLRYLLSLWAFGLVYLLFWMHVVRSGPRLHRPLQPGLGFLYVLLGGEVPNMVTGVTLAFREHITYPVYSAGVEGLRLSPLLDQTLSGCLLWVVGTAIYVSVCLGILGRVFRNEDAPRPMPIDWEATRRTIAPGLEHRVR